MALIILMHKCVVKDQAELMMAGMGEPCRLQDPLAVRSDRGGAGGHEIDGRIATLVDALGALASRCAAMRRVSSNQTLCHSPLHHCQTM